MRPIENQVLIHACPAGPSSLRRGVGVLRGECMPLAAEIQRTLSSQSIEALFADMGIASPYILRMSYSLQMPRIHADSDSAQVVELKSIRHGTFVNLIRDDVSQKISAPRVSVDYPISSPSRTICASPEPASAVGFGRDAFPESFDQRTLLDSHVIPPESHRYGLHGVCAPAARFYLTP